jgi:hypothetical protein
MLSLLRLDKKYPIPTLDLQQILRTIVLWTGAKSPTINERTSRDGMTIAGVKKF